MITGLAVAGFGAGALVFTPIAKAFIAASGIMPTFMYLGIIFLVAVVLGAQLMVVPPAGFKPASLPPDLTIKTAHVDYSLHWSFDGQKLGARHELTTAFDSPLCGGAVRSEVLSALDKIGDAFKQELALVQAH